MRLSQPILVAHRGAPSAAPENTIASLEAARRWGARWVEFDLRQSQDGVWVAFHDERLKRTAGRARRLDRTPWRDLKKREVGSWFSPAFTGEPIPQAAQVLAWCKRHRMHAFLDVKISGREASLSKLIKRSGCLTRVVVGAGTLESVRAWRKLLPNIPLFWVTGYSTRITPRRIDRACRVKATGLASYRRWIRSAEWVRALHRNGLQLYVWTARTSREIRRLKRLGVDGIMSEVWPPPSI